MRALREGAGRTQVDVAEAAQIDQSDISRLESKHDFDDCQVSTLRRYVDAIGGRLELVAAFGDKKIVLVGVEGRSVPISLQRKHARKATRKSKT
jgi:predicted transcriptional regulator